MRRCQTHRIMTEAIVSCSETAGITATPFVLCSGVDRCPVSGPHPGPLSSQERGKRDQAMFHLSAQRRQRDAGRFARRGRRLEVGQPTEDLASGAPVRDEPRRHGHRRATARASPTSAGGRTSACYGRRLLPERISESGWPGNAPQVVVPSAKPDARPIVDGHRADSAGWLPPAPPPPPPLGRSATWGAPAA